MKTFDELKALIEKRGVHAEFGEPGEGWGIEQSSFELATFLTRMQELGVSSCLEIGTGYKGGLSRFLAADMGWSVTSVDINPYHHVFEGVHYIVGNDPQMVTGEFDLVFIDGDHSYNAVKNDYIIFGRMATKAVAFHDIAGLRDCEGAVEFWHDIRQAPGMNQIIEDSPRRAGIGYLDIAAQHEEVFNS